MKSTNMKSCLGNVLLSLMNIISAYACGGTHTATSGAVTSPGYPSDYNTGETCTYYITSNTGVLLRLVFPDFEVEGGFDFVNVYNSIDVRVSQLSGERSGTVVKSSTSYKIQLISDAWTTRRGFRAVWAAAPSSTVKLALGPHILCPIRVTFTLVNSLAAEAKVHEIANTTQSECQTLCLLLSACIYHKFGDDWCTVYEYEAGASVDLAGGFSKK